MATPYKVGDLEVSIKAISNNAITSLDGVINRMTSLSSILKTITASDMKWITSLGTRMKTLSKNMASVNWKSLEDGFSRLTVAITPFLNKITSAQASLQALNATIDKLNTKKFANLVDGGGKKQSRSAGRTFLGFGKITATFYIARRLAGVMADIVQYGVDYTETLNLWQVAMRDNLSMATEFVNKMSKAYGISQKTLMQAQATFRNMIGSLGDLSDSTSYALSEAITQMAIDYSSLYNAPIEEAINKFQSALAGQVRPIRSISGYDITEKTIQALYEALGGTKTQRQLSRTEKQLLAIYAIFNQMEKSGALGDMTKTLDNFANQSRMMVENWKEFATWFGTVITYLLQKSEIMVKINAALITGAEIMKALAFSIGYETPNFAAGWENSVDNTIEAVDELKGKLLGFDKIRAMNTEQDEISIDEKLLQAISGYSSLIDQANNKARKLADTWKELTFWEDGVFQKDEAEDFFDSLKQGVKLFAVLYTGLKLTNGKAFLLGTTLKNAFSLKSIGIGLLVTSLAELYATSEDFRNEIGAVWNNLKAPLFAFLEVATDILSVLTPIASGIISVTDSLGLLEPAIYAIIGIGIANKIAKLVSHLKDLKLVTYLFSTDAGAKSLLKIAQVLNSTVAMVGSFAVLGGGIALFVANFDKLSDKAKVWIPVLSALAGVIASIAVALAGMSFKAIITAGSIVAGIGMVVGTLANVEQYAKGGTPDKGTLFIAGEAGAEIVSTSSNGQTGVSNVQQIEQAFYNALVRYGAGKDGSGGITVVKIGEREVFRAVKKGANSEGYDFVKKG